MRPLVKTRVTDLPDSDDKQKLINYVEHHMAKVRKECGNTPSRKLINNDDQGFLWIFWSIPIKYPDLDIKPSVKFIFIY